MAEPASHPPHAAAVAEAVAGWPLAASHVQDDCLVLTAAGRVFATVVPAGVELRLPPRVRDMLVETGRAAALPHPGRALVPASAAGAGGVHGGAPAINPDLLRLAYERARIAAAAAGGGQSA